MTEDIRQQRDRFVAFSFAAAELLIEVGPDNRIAFASGAAQKLLAAPAHEQLGRSLLELFPVSEHPLVAGILADRSASGRFGPVVVRLAAPGRQARTAILNGCRLPHDEQRLYLTVNPASLPHAAEPDAAEHGMLDAEAFAKLTAGNIRAAHALGQDVKLTLFDMSGVDEMRALVGADPTDAFLSEVGGVLRSRALANATARLADDKYGILHDAAVDPAALQDRLTALAQDMAPPGAVITVGSSTVAPDADFDEAEMARALLHSLTTFVQTGSERFSITSMTGAVRSMMDTTLRRMTDFKTMIAQRRMELRFQPIVDLRTRQPRHHEVLVRFDGDKSPYEVIKFAESVHLVHEMDLAICEAAFEELARDPPGSATTLAVNLSAQSLQQGEFVNGLLELCRRNSRFSRRLIFEITESTELQDLAGANHVIQQLRQLGHRLCLDDFGAGFASFQYLHALDVDYVKLDGKYIRSVLERPRDRVMLKAMVGLCRDLNIRTVGEMIETESQARALLDLGVEFGQGWLFGKPEPEIAAAAPSPAPRAAAGGRRRGSRETWE